MQLPLQISFRQMDPSPEIEAIIRERAAKLQTFAARMTSCRVVVEPAGKHRQHGNPFAVRVDITLPGGEIVASREEGDQQGHQDVALAIRDAFDAAQRQLEDYVRRQRGDVKAHGLA